MVCLQTNQPELVPLISAFAKEVYIVVREETMEMKATENADGTPADAVQSKSSTVRPVGGWITIPFIAVTMFGLGLSAAGATSNIIVYLIKEFNIENVDAAQINNIINGCTSLAPVAGAIVSDGFFGSFPVIAFSTFVNFLSLLMFTATAIFPSLRPSPCSVGNDSCERASTVQLAVLYLSVALLCVGTGGSRFNMVALGAHQFDRVKDKDMFFNLYFAVFYLSAIVGLTVIVYVQDNVSWVLGYGVCAAASAISVASLMIGSRHYRRPKAEGSPFTGLARVVVASIRKRRVGVRRAAVEYHYGTNCERMKKIDQFPTQSLSFLNRAAAITEGDTNTDGSIAKPWRLCTVEELEDLKSILRISPLWSTSLFLSTSIGVQISLTILQALTMNRTIHRHFSIPASSIVVSSFATVAIVLPIIDRLMIKTTTPLQRVGVGHVCNALAMAASALVERRRAAIVRMHDARNDREWIVPMSVAWLVLPMAMSGLGEALHFPGQMSLYYQEFPESMRSTSTAMVALLIAVGFYTSTAVIGLVRRKTCWLPDNLNDSRLDNVYWMLAGIGAINFGYYLVCATLYRYKNQNAAKREEEDVHDVQDI